MDPDAHRYFDRELSWLSFNGRVLQEARDPSVPLFDRLLFLSIFSSNLDEFFRVRVAALRSLLRLRKKKRRKLDFDPGELLREIRRRVTEQQELFGDTFRGQILPELEEHGIVLVDERTVAGDAAAHAAAHFREHVAPILEVQTLQRSGPAPFLVDRRLYLVVELWEPGPAALTGQLPDYALVAVPSDVLPRFVPLPHPTLRPVIFLDDVLRLGLPSLFPEQRVGESCAVKLSRDADLYLEDEFEGDLVEKIRKGLSRRDQGVPSRFLYDARTPAAMLDFLQDRLELEGDDLVPGWRYHNLHDFARFPRFGLDELSAPPVEPLPHPVLTRADSVLAAVAEKDRVLHFPYQSYQPVVRFLEEAADDPDVRRIWITLYRVADDSAVVRALVRAARRGIPVTAFVEVKARFDEESNLRWADEMEAAGVRVLYSMPGLKVHAKLALVARDENGAEGHYAYLGTGNFNERTARVYADHGLLTADPRLTGEVRALFDSLAGEAREPSLRHLLVAPEHLRKGFEDLVAGEVEEARSGGAGRMILKMNSLEDRSMIDRLYRAGREGVRIELIVRGICCLIPGAADSGEGIRGRSIVDRFLEHARVYVFGAGGEERIYLASADWMNRNLSHRVEVAFPLYDPDVREEVRTILDLQRMDNVKARMLDAEQSNAYVPRDGAAPVRSQEATYRYLAGLLDISEGARRDASGVDVSSSG